MTYNRKGRRNPLDACGHFNRRFFLGGAGVVVALPFLESLARAATAPRRLVWMFMPNGMWMNTWGPGKPALAPLEPWKGKFAVVSGLSNRAATLGARGSHAQGTGCWLTCVKVEHETPKAGISADQVAARVLGEGRRLRSLQVGVVPYSIDHGDGAFKISVYHNHISWASATQPLEPVSNPQTVFNRLFAGFDPSESKNERLRRLQNKASVLDYVSAQATSLAPRLGRVDRVKLDEYMSSVRELELDVGTLIAEASQPGEGAAACGAPPSLANDTLTARAKAINGLVALAFQCDITRVVSNMMTKPQDGTKLFTFLPRGAGNHHNASHNASEGGLLPIDLWHVEHVADLMAKLAAIDDVDGRSVLDNTGIVFGNELSNGEAHSRANVPMLAAGGLFDTSRHVHHNGTLDELHLTALHAAGVREASFGAFAKAPISALLR